MRRYRMTQTDATGRPLWTWRGGWAALCRANHNDAEIVMICRALCVGQTATFGGGAAPITRITREA